MAARRAISARVVAIVALLASVLAARAALADLAKADALRAEGKLEEAAKEYTLVLDAQPDSTGALLGLGICLTEIGKAGASIDSLWEARRHLDKLVALAPGVAEHRYWSGYLAAILAPFSPSYTVMLNDMAASELGEALKLDPGHWAARFQLAQVLNARGDPAGAIESFAQAIKANPDRLEPYPLLALSLYRIGRMDECIDTATALLQRAPGYAFARKIIGDALEAKQMFAAAEAEFLLGFKAEPGNPVWSDSLWKLFARSKSFEHAADVFREISARHPDLEAPRRYFAVALGLLGRHSEAAREYGELSSRFPGYYGYFQGLADSLEKTGKEAEAVNAWLESLRRAPPEEAGAPYYPLKRRFEGLRLSARFREAADLLRRVADANPEPKLLCWVYWELAENLQQLDDKEGTFAALAKAMEIDPIEPRFLNSKGLFLLTLGRAEEAIAEFNAALEISPGFMYSIENLAATWSRLRRDDEAKKMFEKGLICAQEQLQMAGDPEVRSEREFDVFKFDYFLHELETLKGGK